MACCALECATESTPEFTSDTAKIAIGFVTTDKLPDGRVIENFWNHSPFDRLRSAETVEDADNEGVEEEDEVVVDDEVEEEDEVVEEEEAKGIDERIDDGVKNVLTSVLEVPVWVAVGACAVFTMYAWTVTLALSSC